MKQNQGDYDLHTLEGDLYSGLEDLLSRGERSDEHYTWEFMRNVTPKDVVQIKEAVQHLDDQVLGVLCRRWLLECIDDYAECILQDEWKEKD